ncbi:hypothetical protein BDR04DRAFT_1091510 [Suillus decipiens]|nr:hypothetical protein BDR04DRAFT_1091510 [Suillus decipiens]
MSASGKTMLPMLANIAPSFPKNPEKCRARTSTPDIPTGARWTNTREGETLWHLCTLFNFS